MSRVLEEFYAVLHELEIAQGRRRFSGMHGRMDWPERGVYFVFEPGETRGVHPDQLRVTRVGAHGLKTGAKTTLWSRLKQHRGTNVGRGNHRGSVFRKHVGRALIEAHALHESAPHWGEGSSADRKTVEQERAVELLVSKRIGAMSAVYLGVGDEAGPESLRGYIERNAIALLSSEGTRVDPPTADWLGHHSESAVIRSSGLWNINHVGETVDKRFIEVFRTFATPEMQPSILL